MSRPADFRSDTALIYCQESAPGGKAAPAVACGLETDRRLARRLLRRSTRQRRHRFCPPLCAAASMS